MRSRRGFFVIWKCLPGIAPRGHFLALRAQGATAPLGPRNDKSESFTPQNAYRKSCQSAWRSASALYRGIKPQEGTGAPRAPLTCHCEAPEGPWQSREGSHDFADGFPVIQSGTARFPRRFAPRNDKPVYLTPLNLCREYRQPPWRSLSAATDAIGAYRYNGSPYESPVRFPALKNNSLLFRRFPVD